MMKVSGRETVKVSGRVNFENIASHQTIKIKTVK